MRREPVQMVAQPESTHTLHAASASAKKGLSWSYENPGSQLGWEKETICVHPVSRKKRSSMVDQVVPWAAINLYRVWPTAVMSWAQQRSVGASRRVRIPFLGWEGIRSLLTGLSPSCLVYRWVYKIPIWDERTALESIDLDNGFRVHMPFWHLLTIYRSIFW